MHGYDPTSGSHSGDPVVISMGHGLGDSVQLTSVITQLPFKVHILVDIGKHSVFRGVCDKIYVRGHTTPPTEPQELVWTEPADFYDHHPSTKVEKCLIEQFAIEPKIQPYQVRIGAHARECARRYVDGRDILLIHYIGRSSPKRKNLAHDDVYKICKNTKLTPIIMDIDDRCGSLNQIRLKEDDPLWEGIGTGDGEKMAALIGESKFFIGIDSGPGHLAACVSTPSIIVWKQHHPLNYYCPIGDSAVEHLIPESMYALHPIFQQHYKHRTYQCQKISEAITKHERWR